MHSEAVILELVGLIYDAAGDATRWPAFLERTAKLFRAEHNTLWLQDLTCRGGGGVTVLGNMGTDASYARSYETYYGARNAYLLNDRPALRPGAVFFDWMLCPPEHLTKTEFFNDWVVPQRMGDGIFGLVLQEESFVSVLCLVHPSNSMAFSEEERLLLLALMPHLRKAIQLHLRISSLETKARAAKDPLDRWSLGVIVLDHQGRVILANRKAQEILNQKDGLSMDIAGLHAARSQDTMALRGLIEDPIQTTLGRNLGHGGGAMALPRPSLKRALNLLVAPVCVNDTLFPETGATCAVFVTDPEGADETDEEALRRFYGLSRAEARVAALLTRGRSVEQISEELYVSLSTARTHMRRIFDKTSTQRQGELVRLLLRSPAHLRFETAPRRAIDSPKQGPKKAS